ncbi:AAA family ATPase [Marinilabiliaceae bacterium ANBcel2]|nr:AAA family ATPase [Marinilabiliaceae bacterium ANBcel2]
MMQAFFKTHKYLLEHLNVPVHRGLMKKVDWSDRLIGILGARGVGKTNFLLDYIYSSYKNDKSCLYVNLNNLYFANRSLVSFADEFQKTGGKILVFDQVFKYPGWADELIYCYDNFRDLRIVFSGSPLMQNDKLDSGLDGRANIYNLQGFSFREYLNFKSGNNFEPLSLNDIITDHQNIAKKIVGRVKPLAFFTDYLHHGYYPFFLEKSNYLENLLKNINLVLEVDISYLQQIELKYLPKLRKLLYILACSAPFQPNISRLSHEIETSRATVLNYLKYLRQARLVNLLYESEADCLRKPSEVYLQNPNLVFSVSRGEIDQNMLCKTFFCNQTGCNNRVSYSKQSDFIVDGTYKFNVVDKMADSCKNDSIWYACDMIESGSDNIIPLWLFGFLD